MLCIYIMSFNIDWILSIYFLCHHSSSIGKRPINSRFILPIPPFWKPSDWGLSIFMGDWQDQVWKFLSIVTTSIMYCQVLLLVSIYPISIALVQWIIYWNSSSGSFGTELRILTIFVSCASFDSMPCQVGLRICVAKRQVYGQLGLPVRKQSHHQLKYLKQEAGHIPLT